MKKKRIKPILHLIICIGIAWMITNGWAYILLGLGMLFEWGWAEAVASAYLALLWLPWTPEKVITIPIAIYLITIIYPQDKAIARYLKLKLYNLKQKLKKKKKGE